MWSSVPAVVELPIFESFPSVKVLDRMSSYGLAQLVVDCRYYFWPFVTTAASFSTEFGTVALKLFTLTC